MRFPPATSFSAPAAGGAAYASAGYVAPLPAGGWRTATPRVAPQGIFDVIGDIGGAIGGAVGGLLPGRLGCFARCGSRAIPCIRCGTDLSCWAQCAGPAAMSCIQECL